jgi:hypothetical protein
MRRPRGKSPPGESLAAAGFEGGAREWQLEDEAGSARRGCRGEPSAVALGDGRRQRETVATAVAATACGGDQVGERRG